MAILSPTEKRCSGCRSSKPLDSFTVDSARPDGRSYLCRACQAERRGPKPKRTGLPLERNPNWKGGRTVAEHGYVLIKRPGHPRADVRGYVYEHILVAEEKIGRPLAPGEEVHHDDLNRSNNHPSNLIVKSSRAEHFVHHRKRTDLRMPDEPNPLVSCACGCGATFLKYDAKNRPRRFVSGHNERKAA